VEKAGTTGRAFGRNRSIRIAPIKGPVSYAVALHELGHLIAPDATGRKHSRLLKELRAWKWAKDNAREWSDRMDTAMQDALRSYLHRAERHHWPIPPEIYQLVEV